MQNGYYCQKNGDHICFKEDGKLIGLLSCKKEMVDTEKCTDCFTDPKQGV